MSIIYTDIEKTLVAHLKTALGSGVHVGTKKVAPDLTQPAQQVVIQVSWAGQKTLVTRYAGVVLDIYADGDIAASDLALLVEAHLRTATVSPIKQVNIISGPVRLGDETEQEKRSISAEVVVKATDL